MAKRFMYVCFGILALVVAFHLGAQYGSASIVDHSTTGIVAACYANGHYVLLDSGEVWRFNLSYGTPGWAGHNAEFDLDERAFKGAVELLACVVVDVAGWGG